jgi:hypothetical protein
MTKHRRTRRRSQKGGLSLSDLNPFGSSETAQPSASPTQSWGEYFSSWGTKGKDAANSVNTTIGNVATSGANAFSDATSSMMSTVSAPFSSSDNATSPSDNTTSPSGQSSETEVNSYGQEGGRRRKRSIKGGSNLAYYAAPVSGLKVAEPTSWLFYANGTNQYSVKGGSKRRKGRKVRRTRRHKKR